MTRRLPFLAALLGMIRTNRALLVPRITTTTCIRSYSRAASAIRPLSSSSVGAAEEVVVQEKYAPPLPEVEPPTSVADGKARLLHLGAVMDRGQAYNPTSGEYYAERMQMARAQIRAFLDAFPNAVPTSLAALHGEWELVLTTVPHGIFRSSPFFLAIQEAYEVHAAEKTAFGVPKAQLFFKLHELQTMSWGVSKVGRVAQHISNGRLYSEFDTSIFSLTVIPIVGWFKLLPTFGGCVVTAADAQLRDDGVLQMSVDYTTARPVPGLSGLGEWIWNVKVPVRFLWKLLPWNQGREPECQVYVRYCDDDLRIVEDRSGDLFVYARPLVPRPLDLVQAEEQEQQAAVS